MSGCVRCHEQASRYDRDGVMQEANFEIAALSLEASSFLIEIQLVRKDQGAREAGPRGLLPTQTIDRDTIQNLQIPMTSHLT